MDKNLVPLTLEQHQQIIYEILYMVDDFCKAHEIPYFLVGGTLLGAVRHQGIIPWDDDADIAMTRENYNRFVTLFHAEGVYGYELYDFEHTDSFFFPFAVVMKKDSFVPESHIDKIRIDVFAYDGSCDSLEDACALFCKKRKKIVKFSQVFLSGLSFSSIYNTWKAKFVYFITQFPKDLFTYLPMLISPFWRKKYLKWLVSGCTRYSVYDSKYCTNYTWGVYGVGEVMPSSSIINLEKKLFGKRELPVPSGWHEYLTGIYGDYMTPPFENNRHPQHLKHGSYLRVSLHSDEHSIFPAHQ